MIFAIQHLKSAYTFLSNHFHELSRPSPQYISNKITFELVHQRNKSFVLIEMLVIVTFLINLFTKTGPLSSNLQGTIASLIVIVIFFLTCRSHPETFRTAYNLVNCLYGVSLTQHGFEGSHGAWQATLVFPSLVYLFTGSLPQYLLSCTAQTFILNTYLPQFLERSVREMEPEDFVRSFTYYTNQTISFSVISVILTHFMIENAYVRISEAETKRENFERQKNFLLGFSHELRNLINSLMGNVKLATLETALSDKVRELLLNAEVCSELLLHMVNNILDTGKVEIGDLEINPSPVRIYEAMERVWSVCSELIKRKSLRGSLKIQKNIPEVLNLDHYRLTQIFLNLIGNAVKFTDAGGIDVNVEWIDNGEKVNEKCFEPHPFSEESDFDEGIFEKKQAFSLFDENFFSLSFGSKKIHKEQLRPPHSRISGILKIIVCDTGVGMDPEDVGKLFQRFTQVTSDVSKRKLGTGLGLFITKELVQRMKGDIKVYSKKGKGTAFIICLPVEPSLEIGGNFSDVESMKSVISRRNLRAMVVDDQAYSRTLIGDFLSNLQVNVTDIGENGLSAYLKFMERSNKGDMLNIITLDLDMPILNGKVAAQRIREMEKQKGGRPCMIIIISGNCVDSEIKECVDKNGLVKADAFLKKPISIEDLGRVIANHFAPCLVQKTGSSKSFMR